VPQPMPPPTVDVAGVVVDVAGVVVDVAGVVVRLRIGHDYCALSLADRSVPRQNMCSCTHGAQIEAAVSALRMLADPIRLRLLWLLSTAEYDVTELTTAVSAARPAVSQHLAKLRLAGLVSFRRDGRRAVYKARGGHVRRLVFEALHAADHHLTGAPDHD